jgi:hypothetical protein
MIVPCLFEHDCLKKGRDAVRALLRNNTKQRAEEAYSMRHSYSLAVSGYF